MKNTKEKQEWLFLLHLSTQICAKLAERVKTTKIIAIPMICKHLGDNILSIT